MRAAFWSEDPPKSTVTPVALRAPELIFGEDLSSSIDVWSFGCLIYEFLTGTALFCVARYGDEDEEADDDHLLELNDVLEPLPESWLKEKWPRASKYFGPNRERLNPEMSIDDSDEEDLGDEAGKDLDDLEDDATDGEDDKQFDGDEDEDGGDAPLINSPLEVLFERNKADDIDEKEAKVITSLLRRILKYEPSQRPSAAELLEHPWFQD